MKTTLIKLLFLASVILTAVVLPACNTTKGFGEDVDALGENMSDSAQEHGAR
jgi:predicted small secreted protein